ncbi:MAG: manganese catalase family protein [Clostridioides sp.]|jgi:bacterioferritin|nr:manganese catalase family protein [Clostridioides sp.]
MKRNKRNEAAKLGNSKKNNSAKESYSNTTKDTSGGNKKAVEGNHVEESKKGVEGSKGSGTETKTIEENDYIGSIEKEQTGSELSSSKSDTSSKSGSSSSESGTSSKSGSSSSESGTSSKSESSSGKSNTSNKSESSAKKKSSSKSKKTGEEIEIVESGKTSNSAANASKQKQTIIQNSKENHSKEEGHAFKCLDPWPETKVAGINKKYAEILMDIFAGIDSEFTSLTQYIYKSSNVDADEELQEMWENMAKTELNHLTILAKVIRLLGGEPKFRGGITSNGNWWHGGISGYGIKVEDQLASDLESEIKSILNYKSAMGMIEDVFVREILKRIIRDEEVHIKVLSDAINKHCIKG